MKMLRRQSGFTLIEVIVVAGIIAILAGILVPLIFKEIDESKISRATADVRSISVALIVLRKDVGQWPVNTSCQPTVTALSGLGTIPTVSGAGWDMSVRDAYENYLMRDDMGCYPATWKGPYMASIGPDPWGRMYLTNANAFLATTGPVWIISAGPDGVVDTAVANSTPQNDDIGMRLR